MSIQITDLKLPERSPSNIISILKSNNMPARLPDAGSWDYNCWGFTAYYCQWEEKALWLDGWQIESHLKTHTHPISKEEVKAGDVAIFRRGEQQYLTHTAIVFDGGTVVCHKPGQQHLCIDIITAAQDSYGTATYARVLPVQLKISEKEFDKSPECVKVSV